MLKPSLYTLRQALFGLSVILIALLDPFGIASSTDDASARWLNRLLAERYADEGQRQVVVVLIDDDYLRRNDTYWPMPYSEQSKLFKRLLAYQPAAVFVDLIYSHDHSRALPGQPPQMESQFLANVFERYRQQGIALFLADTGPPHDQNGVSTLARLAAVGTPALVTWSGFANQYPLAVNTPAGAMETPALRLYREYCRQHECSRLPADARQAAALAPMTVQWGLRQSPLQAKVADVSTCTVPGLFEQLGQAIFWKLGQQVQATCPYTLTLSPSDLAVTDEQDQALLRTLLQGKLVLVGAQIVGTGDLTPSALHGKVAGVYWHAMALDNLVNWGMNYYRSPPSLTDLGIPAGSIDLLDIVELLLLGAITWLKGTLDAPLLTRADLGQRRRIKLRPLSSWVLVLAAIGLVSAVLWHFNFTPANVLGLLLLSLTLFSTRIQALFANKA